MDGRTFDPIRFFCDEHELVHLDDRTYAFSSQWGAANREQAMAGLHDAFPDQGIDFVPSE